MTRRFILGAFAAAAALVPISTGGFVQAAPSTVTAPAVVSGGGLAITSTTTYLVDPVGVVRAVVDLTLTNQLPDQREGYTITRRYFSGVTLPVPVGSANFAATARGNGQAVTSELMEGNGNYFLINVAFPNLFYRQTVNVSVTYDVTGFAPRSENPSRVNAAYASFQAYTVGDAGQATVRVVVPSGFEVETFGDDITVTEEFGTTVYTAAGIENPDEYDVYVSARNDDALAEDAYTDQSGRDFVIRSWPGDLEWIDFVHTQIDEGLPLLEDMIGQPWPIEELEVREAYTPYFYGYAGWFSAADEEIEMGEELDQVTMLHELSHAWFNGELLGERWLSEGLAEVYSNRVVDELGGSDLKPIEPSSAHPGELRLNQWDSSSSGTDDEEEYGYAASYFVMNELIDAAGDDGMRDLFEALFDDTIAYRGEAEPEPSTNATDWRYVLDLLEEVAGADNVVELFESHVVAADEEHLLADRSDAREAYADLADDGGEWAVPIAIRKAMAGWNFDHAEDVMVEAQEVLALRDDLDALSGDLGVAYPGEFETDYEAATGTDDLDVIADDIQAQIDATTLLLAAVDADAADDSLLERIGLMGTDLQAELDDAKAALSEGDLATSDQAANSVIDTVDAAGDVGTGRVLTGGGILLGIVVVLIVVVLLVRWRLRKRRAGEAALVEAATPDTETLETAPVETAPLEPGLVEPQPVAAEPLPDV